VSDRAFKGKGTYDVIDGGAGGGGRYGLRPRFRNRDERAHPPPVREGSPMK
jgi:hypothetical protein